MLNSSEGSHLITELPYKVSIMIASELMVGNADGRNVAFSLLSCYQATQTSATEVKQAQENGYFSPRVQGIGICLDSPRSKQKI